MSCVKAWSFWPYSPYLKHGLAIKPTFFPMFCSPGIHSVYAIIYYAPRKVRDKRFTRHIDDFNCIWCSKVGISRLVLSLGQGYRVEQHTELCLFHGICGVSGITKESPSSASHGIHCLRRARLLSRQIQRRSNLHVCVDWGQELHKAALTGVGLYGEIRLALQYAVDKFSAVPIHRIVGICRCYPSNRGTCETEGQSQSVCSSRLIAARYWKDDLRFRNEE